MSSYISQAEQKILWGRSGNVCAIPGCNSQLTRQGNNEDLDSVIGEMAHIFGEKAGAARYAAAYPIEKINTYENLILVCPTCHSTIDKNESEFTIEKLKEIKRLHEQTVILNMQKNVPKFTFTELSKITAFLKNTLPQATEGFIVIPPKEKIIKNKLSPEVETLIANGMSRVNEVENFINSSPDIEYGERLKTGFVAKYLDDKKDGLSADNLFFSLLNFAAGYSSRDPERAAGLSVLVYFFEQCEVFEK